MAESRGQVVVGVDADADAPTTAVIAAGAREATRLHLGLLLVHPLPASPPWLVGLEPPRAGGAPQLAQRLLDHLVEKTAAAHPGIVVRGILRSGSPASALLAGSAKAALILVPLHTAADEMLREATVGGESTYPDVTVVRKVLYGDNPVRALNNAAADADIVVVGARGGGGIGSLLLGSISDGLVRYATRTVAVVRDE
ncbi:universal stress protein [Micromonospora sp. NPDC023888]|uniref:universal stress protein n=1 Tax=Micromonospora sp. NPDC023888 TaxID=3155607 RepID=UPI0033ED5E71